MDSSPPIDAEAVTPHDTNDMNLARALYFGTGGHVSLKMFSGAVVVLKNIPTGTRLSGGFLRVNATDTTATDIVAFR
jgi:hypothetical protein